MRINKKSYALSKSVGLNRQENKELLGQVLSLSTSDKEVYDVFISSFLGN